jgi:hypothetical protein
MRRPETAIAVARAGLVLGGIGFAVWVGWGSAPWWALPVLFLAALLSEWASVRLVVGQQGAAFTLNDAFMAIALLVSPGAWIAVAVPLGYAVAKFGKRPWVKLSYNTAQQFCAAAVGVLVTQVTGGGVLGACLGLLAFGLVNHLAVAVPISVTTRVRYDRVLITMGPLAVLNSAGNISIGALAGWLWITEPVALLGLIVPIGLLWWSYQQQSRRASEARLFAELARGQERLGGSVDASAQVILAAAGQLFGAASVEMVLRHPGGLLRYVGDDTSLTLRERADADALDAPWVLRALAAHGVMIGSDSDRPYCSAVLGDPDRPLAVLIAHRPERAAPFTRGDVQLAQVLAGQAESWLSVAEMSAAHDAAVGRAEAYGAASRVLGDLGVETVPALAVLRESAHRLSRLASSYDGPDAVSEIVAELYSVERAVASLLGAISLASGGEAAAGLPAAGASAESTAGDAEWTTTGRIEDAVGP